MAETRSPTAASYHAGVAGGGRVGPDAAPASRSERGTRVAALFYSLIESAKLAWVEPPAYLGEAARRAIRSRGAVTLARDLK